MALWMHCRSCGDDLRDRVHMLSGLCWDCREQAAKEVRNKWCVVPMHKSNYFFCTNKDDLHGINSKGGLVR